MNNTEKTTWQSIFHYTILSIIMLFSVTLQSAAGGGITLFGFSLLPAVAFVVGVSVNYGPLTGGIFGLVVGLLLDAYTVPSEGFHLVIMPFLGIACALAANHLLLSNRYARFVLCFVSSLLYTTAYFVLLQWMLGGHDFSYFFRFTLPGTLVCTLTCLLYGVGLRWFRRW